MAFQRTRRPSLRSGRSLRSLGSPLNAYPLGALRLSGSIAVLLAAIGSAVFAETVISHGPSPAGMALRLIATGTANAESLSGLIVEAAEKKWSHPLMPRLLDVLDAYSRDGEVAAGQVSDAFTIAEQQIESGGSKKTIAGAAHSLRTRLKSRLTLPKSPEGWFEHNPEIPLNVPITGRSQGEWPMPVFRDRIASLLEQFLPKGNRRDYVREGLRAYLSNSCESFLGGKLVSTCQEVRLFPLRYQALRLAFAGINSDGADPSIAVLYLSQGVEVLEEVCSSAELIHPAGFSRQCSILRKWLRTPPSAWEVWADLEPELR